MMRYRLWSAWSMIVAPLLAVSLACGAHATDGGATSVPPTGVASSAVPRAAVGTAIDDYLAHGSVNLQNIRAVLVSQRGELLAERYFHRRRSRVRRDPLGNKECDVDVGRHRLD
jgi:hypothetical protein